jgi:GntR family transcriptional regulator
MTAAGTRSGGTTVDRLTEKLSFRAGGRISRAAPVPLHVQFRELFQELIEQGDLRPGEQFPRERELAAGYGVSLAPIRQAILDLAKEGYVYRVQGRGTFVRAQVAEEKIAILSSFSESLRAQGMEPELHVLRQELVPTPPPVARALRTRERKVLVIERLASVAGEPVALLTAYLSQRTFPGLTSFPLEGRSLYAVLREEFGVTMSRAESVVEVARCGADHARLLHLAAGAPVLQVEGTTFDDAARAVEFATVRYRADRFKFRLESFQRSDQGFHIIEDGSAESAPGA